MKSLRSLSLVSGLLSLVLITTAATSGLAALSKASPSGEEVWRLNCGAPTFDYTDPNGNWWTIDEAYTNLYRWGFVNGAPASVTQDIADTTLDPVFQSYRYGGTTMSYKIEVPNGMYQVKLLFSENYWNQTGKRVFNVAIEGVTVLANHDVFREKGRYRADEHTFWPTVSDQALDITFPVVSKDKAMICGIEVKAVTVTDEAVLDFIQKKLFWFFWNEANPTTGLIKWGELNFARGYGDVSSVAVDGMGLSALTVAAERGWVTKQQARDRAMNLLNSFDTRLANVHGFWYHFVDINSGARRDSSEVSTIDSAIFIMGALQAGEYFRSAYPEVAAKAEALYRRMDWGWWLNRTRPGLDDANNNQFVNMGWKPEYDAYSAVIPNNGPDGGFFVTDWWNRYCETLFLDVAALGSPTYPLAGSIWKNMYRWKVNAFGMDFIQEPPLFTHQYQHLWLDFMGRYDGEADYFENARRATLANRQTCLNDAQGRYEPNRWGLTGCGGPTAGYVAYGSEPGGSHDGTVAPSAPIGSLEFTPAEAIAAARYMFFQYKHHVWGRFGFCNSFNVGLNWKSDYASALENGASILAIENYRSGMVKDTGMRNAYLRAGLKRALAPVTEIVQHDSELHRNNWQPVRVQVWNLSESFQDFEQENGTPGVYFWDAWDSQPAFAVAPSPLHRGSRALATQGHTVGIHPRYGTMNLSEATHAGVWVYDTAGNNPVELRLRDTSGATQPIWSTMATRQGQWTLITWPLASFAGVNRSSIQNLEIYEMNKGQHYYDDLFFSKESDITVELKDGGGTVRSVNTVDGVIYEDGVYDVWVYTPTDLVVGWNYFYYTYFYPAGSQNPWEARYDDDTTADEPWIPVTW
ncbi:MAG: glucoamylase family protein [Verrucomicrobiota bacterium]